MKNTFIEAVVDNIRNNFSSSTHRVAYKEIESYFEAVEEHLTEEQIEDYQRFTNEEEQFVQDELDIKFGSKFLNYQEIQDLVNKELKENNLTINFIGLVDIYEELDYYQEKGQSPKEQLHYIITQAIPDGSRTHYFEGV